jgi:hypothetical protein
MRRDVFIDNDSGGLSVVSAARVPEIVADARQNDGLIARSGGALLLELYGDDSMPVRIVADEPPSEDEQAQWLACVRWRIDAPDGRILVAGGFDPDILSDWLAKNGPDDDGYGVAVTKLTPGSWHADLYAHVGSMNGRQLLGDEAAAWFRRDHPGRPFPLWLVRLLRFSGDEDPGHEELWRKPDDRIRSGELPVDLQTRGFVGFLLHLHQDERAELSPAPEGGWFALDTGARRPAVCPIGIATSVEDRELVHIARSILQEKDPEPPLPFASEPMRVLDGWAGEPLAELEPKVELEVTVLSHAYVIGLLASEGAPAAELRVSGAGDWAPAPAQPDWVALPHADGFRAGPPPNYGGWAMLTALATAGRNLAGLPDGARLELATRDTDGAQSKAGRLWFAGSVQGGQWRITHASPRVAAAVLQDALAFARELLLDGRLTVRGEEERAIVASELEEMGFLFGEPAEWQGDTLRFEREKDRVRCMIAGRLFRHRYGDVWSLPEPDAHDDAP